MGFDVHRTRVAYIEMSLSQGLERNAFRGFLSVKRYTVNIYLLYVRTYDIYFPLTCSASPECAKMMLFLKQAELAISGFFCESQEFSTREAKGIFLESVQMQ